MKGSINLSSFKRAQQGNETEQPSIQRDDETDQPSIKRDHETEQPLIEKDHEAEQLSIERDHETDKNDDTRPVGFDDSISTSESVALPAHLLLSERTPAHLSRKRRISSTDRVTYASPRNVRRETNQELDPSPPRTTTVFPSWYNTAQPPLFDGFTPRRHHLQDSHLSNSSTTINHPIMTGGHVLPSSLHERSMQFDVNQQVAADLFLHQQQRETIGVLHSSQSRYLYDSVYGMPDPSTKIAIRNLMGQPQLSGSTTMQMMQDLIFGAGNFSTETASALRVQTGMGEVLMDRLSSYPNTIMSTRNSMATQLAVAAQQNVNNLVRSLSVNATLSQDPASISAQIYSSLRTDSNRMSIRNPHSPDYPLPGSLTATESGLMLPPGLASLSEQRRRLMNFLDASRNQLSDDALSQTIFFPRVGGIAERNGFQSFERQKCMSRNHLVNDNLPLVFTGPDHELLRKSSAALLRPHNARQSTSTTSSIYSPKVSQDECQETSSNVPNHPEEVPQGDSIFPLYEAPLPHYRCRVIVPLATDEDENWLSVFMCFIRSHLVEVFRASIEDVASRINSKKVSYGQIGVRCRFCAHLASSEKASRSACYPSSLSRIYQSLTMMIRDHFINCTATPMEVREKFVGLKSKATQGASDSKRYWIESALKLGLRDRGNPQGIMVNKNQQDMVSNRIGDQNKHVEGDHPVTTNILANIPVVSASPQPPFEDFSENELSAPDTSMHSTTKAELLVSPTDKELVSDYLYVLMQQVERVCLTQSERVGNRKTMSLGLPGFGCRHCLPSNRKGMCRFFPARRRTLPSKMNDLHTHLQRCSLCPGSVKAQLRVLRECQHGRDGVNNYENQKAFFDRIWARLKSKCEPNDEGEYLLACADGDDYDSP